MRRIAFTTALGLAISWGSIGACFADSTSPPFCIIDFEKLPKSWRPSKQLQATLSFAPWSKSEAKDAERAVEKGAEEMISYFKKYPEAVKSLWDDSIEALLQVTYSSANTPEFDAKVSEAARNNLGILINPYLNQNSSTAKCEEFQQLLPLSIFAHKLYPPKDLRTTVITTRTNAAYQKCGSLEAAAENNFWEILADTNTRTQDLEELFDLYIWSLWFIEAELFPAIQLPAETRDIGPKAWAFFNRFMLAEASQFEGDRKDKEFVTFADLVTHIVHIPSGVHRFPLYKEDSEELYRFHRENFYSVMQAGDLDLFASFVDSLRQYGCTAINDQQVRDGSRYLLKVFHKSNDSWMKYRQEGETAEEESSHYDLIHHPWTAILGLRVRNEEQPKPGTYGGIVRRWLRPPH